MPTVGVEPTILLITSETPYQLGHEGLRALAIRQVLQINQMKASALSKYATNRSADRSKSVEQPMFLMITVRWLKWLSRFYRGTQVSIPRGDEMTFSLLAEQLRTPPYHQSDEIGKQLLPHLAQSGWILV